MSRTLVAGTRAPRGEGPASLEFSAPVRGFSSILSGTTQVLVTPASPLAAGLVRGADVRQIILSPKDIERFWSRVAIGGPDDCWEWQGTRTPQEYGAFSVNGISYVAHRVSWMLANGADPGSFVVRHRCDNPPCVNPSHLLTGTNLENIHDKLERGRQAVGERFSFAKLTAAAVREIRLAASRGEKHADIAIRFGVCEATIQHVARRRTWKHVDDGIAYQPRDRRGEQRGNSKLTEDDVLAIRAALAIGETHESLATRFQVSRSNIYQIGHRKTWTHVGDVAEKAAP